MTKNTSERMKELVAKFVLKYNYWGYLFSRVRRRPQMSLPSIMGVSPERDGTVSLYYQPDMVAQTDDANLQKVIEHEGMHLLNKHIPRLLRILSNEVNEGKKPGKAKIFNVAADCSVNQQANLLTDLNIAGKPWKMVTPDSLKLPSNKLTEWYYLELLKNTKWQEISVCQQGEGGLDSHDNWTKNISGVADLSSLSRKIDTYVQDIIKESVKSFNKDRGTIPGHIAQLIDAALQPPKVPYYQIIRKLIKASRLSKFKRSPTKINRKRTYTFLLGEKGFEMLPQISPFPGRTRDFTFKIIIMIDTSGSMSEKEILEGLSGVKNIIENDRYCYATVLEVDTIVEKEYDVKRLRDLQFNIKGRGGTTLFPGLERAKELNPDVVLAFTDGGCENINSIPRKLLPKKIIWVVTGGGSASCINETGFIIRIDDK